MRKIRRAASFGALMIAATVVPAAVGLAATDTRGYIVVLADGANPDLVAMEHARAEGAAVSHVYRRALQGYAAQLSTVAAARVARDPRVRSVQPDREVRTTAQTVPAGIDRADAELSPTAKIDGVDNRVDVDVAIIDTGIDLDHPDLNVYTAGAKNCSTGRSADDGNGHGTHVAGTVGARDNTEGVVGVAPGARLWPVRVLNNAGSGSWSSVICGIDYVTTHADKIDVANLSLGGSGSDDGNCGNSNDDALHKAICASVAAGVTYVVAAGNSHADAQGFVPAAYEEVITVSALADFNGAPGGDAAATCRADEDDTFADFSNFGPGIDLIASGVCILSTWKGGRYNTISGTSMASAHTAGGAALYRATHPDASPADVKSALQAAGTTEWVWPSQDPDAIQERLLNVGTL